MGQTNKPFSVISSKSGKTFYLHAAPMANGNVQYFFSLTVRDNAIAEIPGGYELTELPTGLPALRKVKPV
jgi:hypothetical protein